MTTAAAVVRVRVPAKVNLFLAVRGTRPDGYHELATVLQTVDLHDVVTAELHGTSWACLHPAARKLMRVRLSHDAGPEVPDGADNLAARAACELLHAFGVADDDRVLLGPHEPLLDGPGPATTIHVEKRIPVAAGMAGGSADAAATLIALDRLWDAGFDDDELRSVASALGSDVPFCLHGGTAMATGTGARTCRVLSRGHFHWVVATADGPGLPTPAVYRAWDELDRPGSVVEPDVVLQALRTGDAELLASGLHNDLTDAAVSLRPELGDGLEALRSAGALAATVSGSGPTLLGLAPTQDDARAVAERVADGFAETTVVTSPAAGPKVSQRLHVDA